MQRTPYSNSSSGYFVTTRQLPTTAPTRPRHSMLPVCATSAPADIVAVAPLVAESGLFAGGGADLSAIVNAGASAAGAIGGGLGLGGGLGGGLTGGLGGASAAAWVSAPVQESESEAPSAASSTWSATSQQPSALRLPSVARSVPNSAQPSAL